MRLILPAICILAACTSGSSRMAGGEEPSGLRLEVVAKGFPEATDLQPLPGSDGVMVVLQKGGKASWLRLADGARGTILELPVVTSSELGLLGIAFHPDFEENRKIYVNYTVREDGLHTRVSEFTLPPGDPAGRAEGERILLRQEQPYSNHNAGQLQFGPDGMLYVGFGDGGSGGDPENRAQDPSTWLGKMLRIDVNDRQGELPYEIPADNPFVGREGFRPEIWALGLRNPWRYSFAPDGRLIVADVGQNAWEEIDLVAAGDNLGWKVREGSHCFEPRSGCTTEGFVDPIFEYPRDKGQSLTGGYVYTGKRIPALAGRYVFTDFLSGRVWSLALPDEVERVEAKEHGVTGRMVATMGRDAEGELYFADFGSGELLRLAGI